MRCIDRSQCSASQRSFSGDRRSFGFAFMGDDKRARGNRRDQEFRQPAGAVEGFGHGFGEIVAPHLGPCFELSVTPLWRLGDALRRFLVRGECKRPWTRGPARAIFNSRANAWARPSLPGVNVKQRNIFRKISAGEDAEVLAFKTVLRR